FSTLCNHPNFESSHRNMAVRSVEMRVHARTSLQLQHLSIVTQGPNPRKCRIKMAHDCFAALAQDRSQTLFLTESHAHFGPDSHLASVRCPHFLRLLSFADIADKAGKYLMAVSRYFPKRDFHWEFLAILA